MDSESTGASLAGPLLACVALAAALVLIFSAFRSLTTKPGATGGKELVKQPTGTASKKVQQSKPSDPPSASQQQAEVLAKTEPPASKAKKRKKKRPKEEDEEEPEAEQAAVPGPEAKQVFAKEAEQAAVPGPEAKQVFAKEAATENVVEKQKPRKAEERTNPVVADTGSGWTEVHKKKGSAETDEQAQRRADRNLALRCRRTQLSERIRRLEEGLRAGGAQRQDKERRSLEERAKLLEDLSRVNRSLQRLAEETGGGDAANEAEAEEVAQPEEVMEDWGEAGGGDAWWAWDIGHHAGPGVSWKGGAPWDGAGAWEDGPRNVASGARHYTEEPGGWEVARCDEQAGGWWEEGRCEEQAGGWWAPGGGTLPRRGGWQGRRAAVEQAGAEAQWAEAAWPRYGRRGIEGGSAGEYWQREENGGGASSSWRGGRYRTPRGEDAGWEPPWEAAGEADARYGGLPRRKGGRKGGGERRDRYRPAGPVEAPRDTEEAGERRQAWVPKGRGRGGGGKYRPFVARISAIAAGCDDGDEDQDDEAEVQDEEPEAAALQETALGRHEAAPAEEEEEEEEEESKEEMCLEAVRAKGREAAALLGARPGQRASWGDAESSDEEQTAATAAVVAAREAERARRSTESPPASAAAGSTSATTAAALSTEAAPAGAVVWDEDLVAFLGEDALTDEDKFRERLRGVPQWVAEKALRTREQLQRA